MYYIIISPIGVLLMFEFIFDGLKLSCLENNNIAHFLVQDLLEILEFSTNNASKFLDRHVSKEFKVQISQGVGRPSWFLLEPGVYQLAFASKSAKSLKFQKWVFEEVLPSIRKEGGYISPDASPEQLEALQAKLEIIQAENTALKHYIDDEPTRLRKAKQEGIKAVTVDTIQKVKASAECFNDDSQGNPIIFNRYKDSVDLEKLAALEKEIKKILGRKKKSLTSQESQILACVENLKLKIW